MSRKAMQVALEALESDPISHAGLVSRKQAISALRQALETEPLEYHTAPPKRDYVIDCPRCGHCCPERTWDGLTDEEIQDLSHLSQKIDRSNETWFDRWGFARAVEQTLKEKNHG